MTGDSIQEGGKFSMRLTAYRKSQLWGEKSDMYHAFIWENKESDHLSEIASPYQNGRLTLCMRKFTIAYVLHLCVPEFRFFR